MTRLQILSWDNHCINLCECLLGVINPSDTSVDYHGIEQSASSADAAVSRAVVWKYSGFKTPHFLHCSYPRKGVNLPLAIDLA